jgi:hypothetical protein
MTNTWLATTMNNGAPIWQGNKAVASDAQSYITYWQTTGDDGAVFLSTLNSELELVTATDIPPMPTCADPQGLYGAGLTSGTFLGDASNATNDTPGSSQALADCQATVADFKAIQGELATTAPGSKLGG